MSEQNKILSNSSAIVDGKWTALAGCDTQACPKRDRCLRTSAQLSYREVFKARPDGNCTVFITN